ncbi:MAG: hypothetical protein WC415_02895 [Patescibacteria group bacterium]|jgi:hypothetical protein
MENKEKIFSLEELTVITESVNRAVSKVEDKIEKINWLMGAVVVVLFVGFLTMLLMVAGLVLDTWRFKNDSYKELIETIRPQEKSVFDNKNNRIEIKNPSEELKQYR